MDRDVLDTIEREIDEEARGRFPGTAVRQAVLLQYGDDPEIEPGDLWVRVLLDADGPEDNWESALTAFEQANKTAIEQFRGYLATADHHLPSSAGPAARPWPRCPREGQLNLITLARPRGRTRDPRAGHTSASCDIMHIVATPGRRRQPRSAGRNSSLTALAELDSISLASPGPSGRRRRRDEAEGNHRWAPDPHQPYRSSRP